ncbi:metallophosphoesterase family protein [Fervidobacterium sp. 2310opik-2]|uniref:metallophosphoesterase family protein n=1 Tax=Fervidobacterium sp. 2310opik-2 TaxID=1755815 RepID=UPI0013E011BE|nr:metallophosphoesterase family protein [Fervidobacterium sp. 2310opik-2]KAF2962070.1 metallophosphatase [Fervidobacterium sp. 2310opik-2]HOJ93721.1 metallophosphoesterase family protein [Fervidobacterium nodosum]
MLWAIGDIHGCLNALETLINEISPTPNDKLVFLGDYIDRGPDSKGVVDFLIELSKRTDCIFLRGNHEQMLLDVIDNGDDTYLWVINGATATWRSYGNLQNLLYNDEHLEFFRNTQYYFIEDKYLFVHGGVRPNIPIEKQDKRDLIWIREEFISKKHNTGYIVIFGHTPFEDVFIGEDKIGIDTGCVYGGKLTAYNLTLSKKVQVECLNG